MANLVKKVGSYSTPKNILIGQESYYIALPIVVSGSANATLKAGSALTGDITARNTAFSVTTTNNVKGILLHDVVLDADGKGNGTLVLAGCIDMLKLDSAIQSALTSTIQAALPRIIFVKGSAI